MSQYLTVTSLVNRLKENNITIISKKRCDLLKLAKDNKVISDLEAVCTRNPKSSRLAMITSALSAVGCTFRTDSKLCEAYIDHGDGDLETVVNAMREMKFYFDHTKYQQIRNELYEEFIAEQSDNDLNSFYSFDSSLYEGRECFNSEEASAIAKNTALNRWLSGYNNVSDAIKFPSLPPSIVLKLVKKEAGISLTSWIHTIDGYAYAKIFDLEKMFSKRCADVFNIDTPMIETHAMFSNLFGEEISNFISAEKADAITRKFIVTMIPKNIANTKFTRGLFEKYMDIASKSNTTDYLQDFKNDITTALEKYHNACVNVGKRKPSKNVSEMWGCSMCAKTSSLAGIISHSMSKHNVKQEDIKAYLIG